MFDGNEVGWSYFTFYFIFFLI